MRALLIGLGLAGLFAAGCGSSTTVDGGTTTGGGTTGGTTTAGTTTAGTTTTTSTSGTTTSGTGGLPAGASCSTNPSCTSDICGVNGTGHCCTALCSTTDATCGASDCDDTGACTYPATSVTCGTVSCNAGMLTASACDGSGACVAGTPTTCPGNFGCNSAGMSCNTTCSVAGDCASGFYCNGSSCAAIVTNGACSSNAACTSGICGLSGTGNCCTTQCTAASDMACDPGCDVTTGACTYPAGNACGAAATCTGSMLTGSACDATGACNVGAPVPCANNFGCNAGGTACNTTCTVATDCASGFWCSGNACVPQLATGPCTENDTCTSGACGTTGSGNCCTAACTVGGKTCGAIGCDATGACMYPSVGLPCGSTSCTNGVLTDSACDGAGTCVSNGGVACASGACDPGGTTCSCTTNSDCGGKAGVCDALNGVCCPGIPSSGAMSVNSTTGSDATACCGYAGVSACQTLTQAMKLIDGAQAQNVTITATVNGGGGDWGAPAGETYPITLGWGVELSAAGVFFLDPNGGNDDIIDVAPYSANDNIGHVSIVGAAGNQVGIGMNALNTQQSGDNAAIQVEKSQTLFIANAVVNGSATNGTAAINVIAGGTLTLGGDHISAVTGTVNIGNNLNATATDGYNGILCQSDYGSLGCTINDVALVKQSSVIIQGQEAEALNIQDFSTVSLTSAPVIGTAPAAAGFNQCNGKPDAQKGAPAIAIYGPATVTFNNGVIQCISGTAISLQTSQASNGPPTLNMDSSTIQNTALGIYASGGTATLTNTTINYNFIGVQQDHDSINSIDGTIDLTGGGNAVICSSNQETGSANDGIDVYNTSQSNLAADNVAWDTTAPDYFSCDSNSTSATCTCLIMSCSNTAPFDDMDAVEDSTNLGGITTTGNSQSPNACN